MVFSIHPLTDIINTLLHKWCLDLHTYEFKSSKNHLILQNVPQLPFATAVNAAESMLLDHKKNKKKQHYREMILYHGIWELCNELVKLYFLLPKSF